MRAILLATAVMAGLAVSQAQAQTISESLLTQTGVASSQFQRDRNVSVRSRPRPELGVLGIRSGAFLIFPQVSVRGLYDDNLYATRTGTVSDGVIHVAPSVRIDSQWPRHRISLRGGLSGFDYLSRSRESHLDYTLGGSGRLDVVRDTFVTLDIDQNRRVEPRTAITAPNASLSPIRYEDTNARLGFRRDQGRFRILSNVGLTKFDYVNGRTRTGAVVQQDFRDRDEVRASGELDYAVSPAFAVYFQAAWNTLDYKQTTLTTLDRDSTGSEISVGADFELTRLMRGRIQTGYLDQNFSEPLFPDVGGATTRIDLEYFPTQLTTVRLNAQRQVQDSGLINSGGYDLVSTGLQVDHELLRNVILTGRLDFQHADYSGVDRADDRLSYYASATYLMNRRLGVRLEYSRLQQRSAGLQRGNIYDNNQLSVTLTSQY